MIGVRLLEKPFIKLFHTPNSGYFYDVGKNEIIRIPEEVYMHLSDVMAGKNLLGQSKDESVCQVIESFLELGYLSSKHPSKIQHTATALVPLLLNRCVDKITLQLTQDCNFRCKYCIYSEEKNLKQRSHAKRSMSLETAQKAIRFYRDHAVDSNLYNVGLYGGEPLLQWDLLQAVVLFAEKELTGKLLTFSLTTNASLMTEPMAAFLEEHNVGVLISFDGVKPVNDKNRVFRDGKGTSDMVLKNIRMIKERHPRLFEKLRINSVIDPEIEIPLFGKYPCELESIPVSSFTATIEESNDQEVAIPLELSNAIETESFHAFLEKFGQYSLPISPYGYGQVENIYEHMKSMKSTNGIQNIMAPSGPCVPGKGRLFVSVDGHLYPCERVNETPAYCIGDLDSGFDYEVAKRLLNVGTITEAECKNCWAIRHCSLCGKYFDYTQKDAGEEKKKMCPSIRSSVKKQIRAMIMLSEMDTYYKELVNLRDSI